MLFDEIQLEHLIITHYNCGFFEIKGDRIPGKTEDKDIELMQVVFYSKDFTGIKIVDRVKEVYELIEIKMPELLSNNCILLHPYTPEEFQIIFDHVSTTQS